jgi:hypothetical protein
MRLGLLLTSPKGSAASLAGANPASPRAERSHPVFGAAGLPRFRHAEVYPERLQGSRRARNDGASAASLSPCRSGVEQGLLPAIHRQAGGLSGSTPLLQGEREIGVTPPKGSQ